MKDSTPKQRLKLNCSCQLITHAIQEYLFLSKRFFHYCAFKLGLNDMILVKRIFLPSTKNEWNAQNAIWSRAFRPSTPRTLITRVLTIYEVNFTQNTALEQKRLVLRSLSPALPTLITNNYYKFLLIIIINFFKNVSLPFTLPSSKNRYLYLLQTGLPHSVMDHDNAIMVKCQKTGRASRRWCASTGYPTPYRPAGGLDLDVGLVVFLRQSGYITDSSSTIMSVKVWIF